MEISYKKLTSSHYSEAFELAKKIWSECYADILSRAQIDYMLDEMYGEKVIEEEMNSGVIWEFINLDNKRAGFLSYLVEGDYVFLKKIYFLKENRGMGILPEALKRVSAYAIQKDIRNIKLTVNKNNMRAISAYKKNGFSTQSEVVVDIGSGYVMDDYILTKPVCLQDGDLND